jgi:CelD/BcsL family acetyltransferase involved in cellulose biosynthesis
MLDLSVLYLDDLPVSFIWGTVRWPNLSILKPGFDQSLSQISPGVVHLARHIQDSIEHHATEIDYGPPHFEYKSSCGKTYRELSTLYYYRNGIKARLLRFFRNRLDAKEMVISDSGS